MAGSAGSVPGQRPTTLTPCDGAASYGAARRSDPRREGERMLEATRPSAKSEALQPIAHERARLGAALGPRGPPSYPRTPVSGPSPSGRRPRSTAAAAGGPAPATGANGVAPPRDIAPAAATARIQRFSIRRASSLVHRPVGGLERRLRRSAGRELRHAAREPDPGLGLRGQPRPRSKSTRASAAAPSIPGATTRNSSPP